MKGDSSTHQFQFLGRYWTAARLPVVSGVNSRPVDRALGAAATLGLCFAILKIVTHAMKTAKREGGGEESNVYLAIREKLCNGESNLYVMIKETIRTLFLGEKTKEIEGKDVVKHFGSCHCGAIEFELVACRNLKGVNSPGKIRYPRVRSGASDFRFTKGSEHANMYYCGGVDGSRVSAYSFCTKCGVHILHAPSSDVDELHVNIDCLDGGVKSVLNEREKLSNRTRSKQGWDVPSLRMGQRQYSIDEKATIFESQEGDSVFTRSPNGQPGCMSDILVRRTEDVFPGRFSSSPGTLSTVSTTLGSDSLLTSIPSRSVPSEHDSSFGSVESESIDSLVGVPNGSVSTNIPRLTTNLTPIESPPQTATPMMRDQLKYYMKKHLKSCSTIESSPLSRN